MSAKTKTSGYFRQAMNRFRLFGSAGQTKKKAAAAAFFDIA